MFDVTFVIEGEPMSKARARVVNGHAFTPGATKRAEEVVGWRFRQVAMGRPPTTDTFYGVHATFHAGTRQRRDVDNMLKLILDGLNGVAWVDDNSVLELFGRKLTCVKAEARTEVRVYEVPADEHQATFTCEHCGRIVPSFLGSVGRRRFCSRKCFADARATSDIEPCPNCGKLFGRRSRKAYCSAACSHQHRTVDDPCAQCGTVVNRPKCWSIIRIPFCSSDCRVAYWREHRATVARGTCSTCGGSTSKKSYVRCRACVNAGIR